MSDFDKEAEREKLRKKFADDEEKRAGTRRMSELLLKGATMTNKHCSRCSDPLFRYDGQTFCPSCQADGAAVEPESQAQGDHPTQGTQTADPEVETRTEAPPETGGKPSESPQPESPPVEPESRTPTPNTAEPTQSTQPQRGQPQQSQPQRGQSPQPPETASSVGEQQEKTQVGGLTDARQSLQRTVTRFAQAAEQTDDPRRARELLAAAREAAATLSELE